MLNSAVHVVMGLFNYWFSVLFGDFLMKKVISYLTFLIEPNKLWKTRGTPCNKVYFNVANTIFWYATVLYHDIMDILI